MNLVYPTENEKLKDGMTDSLLGVRQISIIHGLF